MNEVHQEIAKIHALFQTKPVYPEKIVLGEHSTIADAHQKRLNDARARMLQSAANGVRIAGRPLNPDYVRWETEYFNGGLDV